MSDDTNVKLMARLAQMEAELATLRSSPRKEPESPKFDPAAFRAAFISDPVGTMTRMGAPVEHVTRVLVAHAMGDQAPPELKVLASMGPQVNATHALDSKVETLSRQLSALTESQTKEASRQSFKALTSDKSKYPHLSKAFAADPSLFDSELSTHRGNAEDLATAIEARLGKFATAFGAPPASENADREATDQSTQVKPAALTGTSGNPPPLPSATAGVFTDEDHQKLKAEIIRKYQPTGA